MSWELMDAVNSVRQHAVDYDRLNDTLFDGHPLLSSLFVEPLVQHFAAPDDLLAVHRHQNDIDALVLLTKRRRGIWQTCLPSQAPIAPSIISKHADLHALTVCLPGFCVALELLCQDPICSFFVPVTSEPYCDIDRHITTMSVLLDGSFEEYWAARSKKLRANVGRYFRRLDKDNIAYRLEIVEETKQLAAAVDRYGDLESLGWKGKQDTAVHRTNAQGRFYSDLLANFSQARKARIYELYFNHTLAASRLCIHNNGQMIMLKTTYLEPMSKYAPGRILLHMLLEQEFKCNNIDKIEFYTNASRDQLSWSTDTRDIFHLTQYRSSQTQQLIQASRRFRTRILHFSSRG